MNTKNYLNNLFWLLVVLVTVGGVSSYITSLFRDSELDDYREQVEQYQVAIDSVLNYSKIVEDSISVLERHRTKLALDTTRLSTQLSSVNSRLNRMVPIVDSLQQVVDTLSSVPHAAREYIQILEVKVQVALEGKDAAELMANNFRQQVMLLEPQIVLQVQVIDSLKSVIQQYPSDVPDNESLFGIIPLPSRTVSFIGGVITTLLVVVAR